MDIQVGDRAICNVSGISGIVTKIYRSTASELQIMIKCNSGRLYHAPAYTFSKISSQY